MIKHHFKIAWRSIWNSKSYTFINIAGLSAGLASFIIVLLYLNYELSYDTWSPELEKVYRVSMRVQDDVFEATPAPLAAFLAEKYPKIDVATSMQGAGEYEVPISTGNKTIYHSGFASADSLFLQVFPYKLKQGNKNTVFEAPDAVIISTELAENLFGSSDPMGKTVKVFNMMEGTVKGVMEMPATPGHRQVHLIMRDPYAKQNFFWNNMSYDTYIKLKQPVSESELEEDINRIYFEERLQKDDKFKAADFHASDLPILFVDAVPDIQNFSKYGSSNIKTVTILFILAILLLLTGAVNFSNLLIAKSVGKTKEIGVRKVLGSGNWNLFWQFMTEAFLQCTISLLIAIVLIFVSLPFVNRSFGLELAISGNFEVFAQIAMCLLTVIMITGLFPSILLSRFKLLRILHGGTFKGNKGLVFRNALIIFQFIVTGFFIIAIVVVNKQLDYLQNRDKGFQEDQLIRIQASQDTRDTNFETVQERLLEIPGVVSVSKTTNVPGDKFADSSTVNFNFKSRDYRMNSVKIEAEYFNTLKTPILKGRDFQNSGVDQHTKTAILNETAAKQLASENIIGETIYFSGCEEKPVQIVGIAKDINILGFETQVQPAVFTINNEACMFQSGGGIIARLNTENPQASLDKIENLWKQIEPEAPLRYSFLDDNFQQLFSTYYRLQKVIRFFGIVAIVISLMGLFALTTFVLKYRVKEIGIRKVLGAEVPNIIALISKDFILLVALAIVISMPIGWYAMNKWLENFAYQTSLNWWIFAFSGVVVLLIALITVSLKTMQAAMKNPVKSLKTE